MTNSINSPIRRYKGIGVVAVFCLIALAILSLFVGKYPLSLEALLSGDPIQWQVFVRLRLTRTLVAVIGGFALALAGFTFQTVLSNPLASPDIIGVSSGASAGAAFGILFLSGTVAVTVSAFVGAIFAVVLTLALAKIDPASKRTTVLLSGIAVHSICQTLLMTLKLTADPERELASIEYWIMGSLNGVSADGAILNLALCAVCCSLILLLHRQLLLLSTDEGEAKMLGVPVSVLRILTLGLATLCVASIVSIAGLISFVGLIAPHLARMLLRSNRTPTLWLCGIIGACLLCLADILARSVAATELPIGIFTGLIGAPFLIFLIFRKSQV